MDTAEVFESDPDDSSTSFITVVIEEEDDVGANVILSTASPPPPSPKPKTTPVQLVKVVTSAQSQNGVKARQNKVTTKAAEPAKPVTVVVQNAVGDYVIETIKEEITLKEEIKDEFAEDGENNSELNADLCEPAMSEFEQYELLYPGAGGAGGADGAGAGGAIEQVKAEQIVVEHDYVSVPDPIREYYCGVCGKSYPSEKSVRQHMTRTHGVPAEKKKRGATPKKIVCEQCGKKYASAAQLRYHQRVHTGERPYQCSECPKAFTMPLFLQLHFRTHTGERPYACPSCPKAFSNQAALLRHDRVHTGEKPYTCEECGKSFTQSNSRKLHVRTVHRKLPAPYMSRERRLRQHRRREAEVEATEDTEHDNELVAECPRARCHALLAAAGGAGGAGGAAGTAGTAGEEGLCLFKCHP